MGLPHFFRLGRNDCGRCQSYWPSCCRANLSSAFRQWSKMGIMKLLWVFASIAKHIWDGMMVLRYFRPHAPSMIQVSFKAMNLFLCQLLTGNGVFGKDLHKMEELGCVYCLEPITMVITRSPWADVWLRSGVFSWSLQTPQLEWCFKMMMHGEQSQCTSILPLIEE